MITSPKIPRKELLKLLTLVKPGLGSSDLLAIVGCLCFDGKFLFTYNDEVGVWVPFKHNIKGALNGEKLIKIVSSSSAKFVDILEDTDDSVSFKMGVSRLKLNLLSEDGFIFEIPKLKPTRVILDLTSDWMEGIKLCLSSIADGDVRIDIRGITFHIGKPSILYSTDNWSLSRYKLDSAYNWGKKSDYIDIIMRPEFCKAVIAAAELLPDVSAKMYVGKKFVAVEFGKQCTIYTRILDIAPLKFAKLIKQTVGSLDSIEYITIPKLLKSTITRAEVITSNDDTASCHISTYDEKLRIESSGVMGRHRDVIKLKEKHPDINVMIHAQLLAKPIALCDKFFIHENTVILSKGDKYVCLIQNREM